MLASPVRGVTTSLLGKRMCEQWALQASGHNHTLHQLEVLA
jgi:hypothetical protein